MLPPKGLPIQMAINPVQTGVMVVMVLVVPLFHWNGCKPGLQSRNTTGQGLAGCFQNGRRGRGGGATWMMLTNGWNWEKGLPNGLQPPVGVQQAPHPPAAPPTAPGPPPPEPPRPLGGGGGGGDGGT